MNHAFKRALSFLMALAMVLSLMPNLGHVHAHAEEVENDHEDHAATEPVVSNAAGIEVDSETAAELDSLIPGWREMTEDQLITEVEKFEIDQAGYDPYEINPLATSKDFSGITVADLGITATDATGSGNQTAPVASWVASGANITGSLVGASGKGSGYLWRGYYYESTTTLTLTNNKSSEALLSFKYTATTNGAAFGDITVNGTKHTSTVSDQEVSVTLGAGESVTVVLHAVARQAAFSMPEPNGASITISNIQLVSQGGVTVNFTEAENGTYTVTDAAGTAVTVPGSASAKSTDRFTMTAIPNEGYSFAGWYNATTGTYLSADLSYTTLFAEDAEITAKFIPTADGVYGVGNAVFTDLTAAAQAAEGGSVKTVVLLKDATLTGAHTIPSGVTLLIPYDADHVLNTSEPTTLDISHSDPAAANYEVYVKPSAFRTLTMASGSSITVNGAISVNARHHSGIGSQVYGGTVYKTYGAIKMTSGSAITLNNAATLYAWGYIWGDGTVTAKSGATIYEKMQITDFRGGSNTSSIALRNMSGKKDGAFPFNQYYIQNVEVKEVLHEGAILKAHAAVTMSGEIQGMAVDFIGTSSAMFSVVGATITKDYLEGSDRLSLSVDGDGNSYAELNGMSISLGGVALNCANFTLPINSNIDININAGAAVVNQELVLQPGVKIFVDSDAALASNANIYVMDIDQWGAFVFDGKRQAPLVYSPALNGGSSRTISSDAVVDINGALVPLGGLFTTAGGARIISSGKTGVIQMGVAAPADSTVAQLTGGSDVFNIDVTSAQLTNGNASKPFTATKDAAEGDVFFYCVSCDTWHREADGCHVEITTVEVTWDYNGGTMEGATKYTEEVDNGTAPTLRTEIPVKAADADYHYKFAGWSTSKEAKDIFQQTPVVTENTTFYAIYTATAHDGTDDGNCTTEVKCSCGYVMVAAKSHVDGDDKNHACDNAGCTVDNVDGGHTPAADDGDCTTAIKCTECDAVTTAAKEAHVAGEDDGDCTTAVKCVNCSKNAVEAKTHVDGDDKNHACDNDGCNVDNITAHTPEADDGDCTTAVKCSVCGTVTTPAKDTHTPEADDGDCTTAVKCVNCSKNAVEAKSHDYQVADYTNNGETHTVHYACENSGCNATKDESGETHDYTHDEEKHQCICGAVESFILYINYCFFDSESGYDDWNVVEVSVPYGAKLADYVPAKGEVDEALYEEGDVVSVDGTTYQGAFTIGGWTDYEDIIDLAAATMPDGEWSIFQEHSYTGWSHVYDYNVEDDDWTDYAGTSYLVDWVEQEEWQLIDGSWYYFVYNEEDYSWYRAVGLEGAPLQDGEGSAVHLFGEDGKWLNTFTGIFTDVNGVKYHVEGGILTSNHSYTTETERVDATCTVDGYVIKACECGATEKTTLTAPGHTDGEPVTEKEVAATCSDDGSYDTVVYCSVCNAELSRETTTVPATGKHVDGDDNNHDCDNCDAENVDGGHTPAADDGDCTTAIYCTECGAETTAAKASHVAGADDGKCTTAVKCVNCDKNAVEAKSHDYKIYAYDSNSSYHTEYYACQNDGCKSTKTESSIPHDFTYDPVNHKCICGQQEILNTILDFNGYEYNGKTLITTYDNYGREIQYFIDAWAEYMSEREGYKFLGWTTVKDDASTLIGTESYKVTEERRLYALWEILSYTITWTVNGEVYTTTEVEYGAAVTAPEYTVPEGYTFSGWDVPATMPAEDITLDATLTVSSFLIDWFVKGWNEDGTDAGYRQTSVKFGDPIVAPGMSWDKEGYTFTGWQNVPETMPAENIVIYGEFVVNKHDITWDVDGETTVIEDVAYGTAIVLPEEPSKTGYNFAGWQGYTEGMTMPDKDVTFTAQWEAKTYTVTWIVDGETYTTTQATYGEAIALPETEPTKTGYTFNGWKNVPETMPDDENLTIEAEFTANVYQVHWRANGGYFFNQTYLTSTVSDQVYGEVIQTPPYNAYAKRTGYTFTGWNTEADGSGEPLTAETIMTSASNTEVIYYAQWQANTYTITWTVNGEVYTTTDVEYGAAVIAPPYVVSEGHTFSGWEVPATMPAQDITLDATLTVNSYTLTIRVGECVNEYGFAFDFIYVQVPYGALLKAYLPETPDIEADTAAAQGVYTFGYWYMDDPMTGVDVDTVTMPAVDTTITASYNYTGWEVRDEGKWFADNNVIEYGWFCVDGNKPAADGNGEWYYGGLHGYVVTGLSRVFYPAEAINGVTYAPNAEDVAYYENKGEEFIDWFKAWFVFGEDGKFQSDYTGMTSDNRWAVNGMLAWHPGLVLHEGSYYYFLGDETNGGNVMASGDVYMGKNSTDREVVIGGVYTYDIDGKLCEYDGITDMPNGTKRYYVDAQLMVGNGLTKVSENFIYVNRAGELIVSASYWVPANDMGIPEGMYEFDENGYLVIPEADPVKDGIYYENGGFFYYENGVIGYNKGLIEVTEIWYTAEGSGEMTATIYVRSNGQLATGHYYVTNLDNYTGDLDIKSGDKLIFGNLGTLIELKNGIVAEGEKLYYYENNVKVYNAGVIELNGNYYYVRSNGEVVNGCNYWITNVGDSGIVAKMYTFDANGVMQNPEFVADQKNGIVDGYYYVNGNIAYGAGLMKLSDENGEFYIYVRSNGQLATGIYWVTYNPEGYDVRGSLNFGTDGKCYI